MIRTAWALGHLPEFADLKLWKWAHMLGFRGHFSSKSRAYSTTLGALRDVRRAWRTAQAEAARIRAGLPVDDENTTLVTDSSWTYLSSGYRPGEELLAAQVRHDIAHNQQAKREAGACMTTAVLTVDQVAERLGISRWKVHDLIRSRELASFKIGRCRRISEAAVDAYISLRTEQEAA